MNHRLHTTLPVLLLLGACATSPPPAPPPATAAITGCQEQKQSAHCPSAAVVNIHLDKQGGSNANPECVSAAPGSTVRVNISPSPKKNGDAITVPADAADGWLVASNVDAAEKFKILISVPDDAVSGEHKYFVLADGACLDPRFVVER